MSNTKRYMGGDIAFSGGHGGNGPTDGGRKCVRTRQSCQELHLYLSPLSGAMKFCREGCPTQHCDPECGVSLCVAARAQAQLQVEAEVAEDTARHRPSPQSPRSRQTP